MTFSIPDWPDKRLFKSEIARALRFGRVVDLWRNRNLPGWELLNLVCCKSRLDGVKKDIANIRVVIIHGILGGTFGRFNRSNEIAI